MVTFELPKLYRIFNLLFTPYRVVLCLIVICSIGIICIVIYINVLHYGLNSILTDHKALFFNIINPLSINLSLSIYIDQFKKCRQLVKMFTVWFQEPDVLDLHKVTNVHKVTWFTKPDVQGLLIFIKYKECIICPFLCCLSTVSGQHGP